jgi:hypothetical protein
MQQEERYIMAVHHFDLNSGVELQNLYPQDPFGPTWMPGQTSLIPMQQELTELRKRFARQRVFLLLFTCVLGATAFIATGLSLYLYFLTSG